MPCFLPPTAAALTDRCQSAVQGVGGHPGEARGQAGQGQGQAWLSQVGLPPAAPTCCQRLEMLEEVALRELGEEARSQGCDPGRQLAHLLTVLTELSGVTTPGDLTAPAPLLSGEYLLLLPSAR